MTAGRLGLMALAAMMGLLAPLVSGASIDPNTTADGIAYFSYDRAAWATNAPSADYYDIHGVPTGASGPTSDIDGQRWIFPQLFADQTKGAVAYPADYLIPLPQNVPAAQPAGGVPMPVNTYLTNSFAAGHKITNYNSTSNPGGYIGLGGSIRAASDFNEPGASVWWEHLALQQDQTDLIWRLVATTGPGQGSVFELINVTTSTVGGKLSLSADYKWGNTDWLMFLQDVNGHLDTEAVLGHIDLVPATVVPVPAGLWLFGSALVGLANLKRRNGRPA